MVVLSQSQSLNEPHASGDNRKAEGIVVDNHQFHRCVLFLFVGDDGRVCEEGFGFIGSLPQTTATTT